MMLTTEAHAHVENFLRTHLGESLLQLPPLFIHGGRFAGWLTQTFRIGAITFGRHIFIAPRLVSCDGDGWRAVPGWLLAHEAVHVIQYEREGIMRFLISYLRGYWQALRQSERWSMAVHLAAYFAIPEERAAREAEDAYRAWVAAITRTANQVEEENSLKQQTIAGNSMDRLSLDSTRYQSNI